ncbi:MAG TPA: NADH-quinone oxidoreductase subunit J [Burkholderiaceae bacterium]|nr:NADH-quinone oxidoreductase subunit J [Burkholderiaceae bacterium]
MDVAFYLAAAVAIVATLLVIVLPGAVHALLYLVVSLLAVAVVFYVLGAPFAAALEVIVYAGAIMVLFIFVMMMLNLGSAAAAQERGWLEPTTWIGPAVLAALLLAELVYVLMHAAAGAGAAQVVEARAVGALLFGPYLLGVELASLLLLSGLVGAYHLGWRDTRDG